MDGHLLGWERRDAGAVLEVAAGAGPGDGRCRTTTFVLGVHDDRLRVELAMLPTSRTVDVSLQPDLFGRVLPVDPGPCADGSAGAAVARLGGVAGRGAPGCGARRTPPAPASSPWSAVAALPLLGAAYDAGAATVR